MNEYDNWAPYEILAHIAYVPKSHKNTHAEVYSVTINRILCTRISVLSNFHRMTRLTEAYLRVRMCVQLDAASIGF